MTLYFTSDTHFGHPLVSVLRGFIADPDIRAAYDRIAADRGRAAASAYVKQAVRDRGLTMRDIADTDAHDRAVIDSINASVRAGDELWILGDVGYRTTMEHIRHCLHAIRAGSKHLVVGNHDIDFHHRERDGEWHHAFASIQDSACVCIAGRECNLSHFPYRDDLDPAAAPQVTDGADNSYDAGFMPDALPRDGRPLLFGHTHQHTKAGPRPDSLHVGLDSWDLHPVSEHDVADWFRDAAQNVSRI